MNWNQRTSNNLSGMTLNGRAEQAPLMVALSEDDEGVTLELSLAVDEKVGSTSARLPGKGETLSVVLHFKDKTSLKVTGRVSIVGCGWGQLPIAEGRIQIKGKKVEWVPSLVIATEVPKTMKAVGYKDPN